MNRQTADIELLRRTSPELAKQHVVAVLRSVGASRSKAAQILGVSERTLFRLIGSLDMWKEVDKIAKECGYGRRGKRGE